MNRWAALLLSLFVCLSTSTATTANQDVLDITPGEGKIIHLTDDTFDETIKAYPGLWIIVVHAPWCSACQQLMPTWKKLAEELREQHDVFVAKINGDRERVLLQRFRADAFPTIYVLSGSNAWKYEGNRNLESVKEFAFQGRLKTDAMERPPHGLIGSLIGKMHKLVKAMKSQYTHLREEHEWSNLTIILAVLAIPVVVGTITICFLDGFYMRRSRHRPQDGMQLHTAPRQE
uniref:Thioredoxin domain-containing protein n=1 Tax=Dunaliella tertiolecta TaxID=3047 RepID=A0A6S8IL97_DUNTE|mmetsp:Transcript_10255/g.27947  ORF Transcript_10255/g.27947 Transcript_10255/m.27947 type:complete len:232 (-) Transcript_10255:595-1290(-)|eukprot:CAMPEP_0202359526 /NCGR_PEP_ID=MMETSP1126-20121109/12787_1 /ASSEMBLY_ACC=CAM_ASM_000457 /TAXON_ID=3047 /ORGANISM="Dunaliella tertiolecta, Strain CCMP1320" /LENGTH=231 /DNA_ID=CAMNT_0048952963 /DNA_START=1382 /DNA_END=2077 /DNA_ORIENTATION=-